MIVTTTESVNPEQKILGLVTATVVMSKSLVGDLSANVKNWTVGGELKVYAQMIDEALERANHKLRDKALRMGGDAIVGYKVCSTQVSEGAAEVIVYGTVVKAPSEIPGAHPMSSSS